MGVQLGGQLVAQHQNHLPMKLGIGVEATLHNRELVPEFEYFDLPHANSAVIKVARYAR